MTSTPHEKDGKADFGEIYEQPDPRDFYATLGSLDYAIPAHAQPIFEALLRARREALDRQEVTVADLCTSYAVNPALLNHHLDLTEIYEHYAALADATHEKLVAADRAWFAQRRRADPVRAVGLDLAAPAVRFAIDVGLLDVAVTDDLETDEPSAATREALVGVDLVTVTGGIGYVTEATVGRVLDCAGPAAAPWFAGFALRWVEMTPIGAVLARHGLELRRATPHSFRQRRFADEGERDYVLDELGRLGIDAEGREAEGWYHADLWLALPVGMEIPSAVRDAAATVASETAEVVAA